MHNVETKKLSLFTGFSYYAVNLKENMIEGPCPYVSNSRKQISREKKKDDRLQVEEIKRGVL